MISLLRSSTIWVTKDFMLPTPLLVGIEVNPGPALSPQDRRDILRWREDGLSRYAIAKKKGCGVKAVRKWINRNTKRFSTKLLSEPLVTNKPGQGRKRKLTARQERQVVKKAKVEEKDVPEITQEMIKKVPGGVEDTTIRRTLRRRGLKYLVRQKVETISHVQAKKRLQFARKRLNYNWEYALFTDEKTFQLGSTKHKSWQDPNDRITDEFKRHSPKIHVWAGIGLHFKTNLFLFKSNMDSTLFCKILKARLPPAHCFGLPPYGTDKWILVQDNDPKHKSKQSQKVLDQLAPDRLDDWPSNSPDFNPMEDLWSMMDSELRRDPPKTIPDLKSSLRKIWKNLDETKIRASIESIPRRLEQCIERQGERTSY
jgi:transposase